MRKTRTLPSGLMVEYRLNEPSGNAISHNGLLDLTDTNTVTQNGGPGNLPFARQFTAANIEYFVRASEAGLHVGGIFTVCAWIRLDSTFAALRAIAAKYFTTGNNREWVLGVNASSQLQFTVSPNGASPLTTINSTATLSTNTWYFVQAGYSGVSLWQRINRAPMEHTPYSSGIFSGTSDFSIGIYNGAATSSAWDGRIAVVRIWRRTLSISELDKIYNFERGR